MSTLSDLVERARYCRDYGNFDALHGDLLEMVEFLDHEFEAERHRANEHFDARTDAEAKLRQIAELCACPFDVLQVEQEDGTAVDTAVIAVTDISAIGLT